MIRLLRNEDVSTDVYRHITHDLATPILTSFHSDSIQIDSLNATRSFHNSFKSSIDMVIEKEIKKQNLPI